MQRNYTRKSHCKLHHTKNTLRYQYEPTLKAETAETTKKHTAKSKQRPLSDVCQPHCCPLLLLLLLLLPLVPLLLLLLLLLLFLILLLVMLFA